MKIKTAVDRITWRLKQKRAFRPDGTDLEAWNAILEWMNNASEEKIAHNTGFAKLYIIVYIWQLEKYQTTPPENIVQMELHKMLDKPLSYFFKRATDRLNEIESSNLLKELGTSGKHPAMRTEEERKADYAKVYEAVKDDPEQLKRLTGQVWVENEVEYNLMQMVSEALIKFKL